MWAMKVHGWSWGVAPYILNTGITWRWVISFVPCPGYHGGQTCLYPLNRSNRAGLKCFAEETNLSALLTVKQQCVSHPACSLVTTLTVLSLFKHFKVACWQNFHHLLDCYGCLVKTEALTYAVVQSSLYVVFSIHYDWTTSWPISPTSLDVFSPLHFARAHI